HLAGAAAAARGVRAHLALAPGPRIDVDGPLALHLVVLGLALDAVEDQEIVNRCHWSKLPWEGKAAVLWRWEKAARSGDSPAGRGLLVRSSWSGRLPGTGRQAARSPSGPAAGLQGRHGEGPFHNDPCHQRRVPELVLQLPPRGDPDGSIGREP